MQNEGFYDVVGRALSSAVWALHCRNNKFGTGYDIKIEGKEATLLLMSGPAAENNVIEELKATSSRSGYGFVDDVTTELQNQLFDM